MYEGQKIGLLTIIQRIMYTRWSWSTPQCRYRVRCVCGNQRIMSSQNLCHAISCGCVTKKQYEKRKV